MIFNLLDTDGSGEISVDEIKVIAETDGYDLNDKDIKAAMDEMDSDGSGEVNFDEFQVWLEEETEIGLRMWHQVRFYAHFTLNVYSFVLILYSFSVPPLPVRSETAEGTREPRVSRNTHRPGDPREPASQGQK